MQNRYQDHGLVAWVDLISENPVETAKFYQELMNYKIVEVKLADTMPTYYIFEIKGTDQDPGIGGVTELNPEAKAQGIKHRMYNNFTVDDLELSASAIRQAGGTTMDKIEIPTVGTMIMCLDPWKLAFCIIKFYETPETSAQIGLPGVPSFFEILTMNDVSEVAKFYSEAFGYESTALPMADARAMISLKNEHVPSNLGLVSSHPGEQALASIGTHYMKNYFNVTNLAETNEKVIANGGRVLVESIKVQDKGSAVAEYSVVADPYGSVFSPIVWSS